MFYNSHNYPGQTTIRPVLYTYYTSSDKRHPVRVRVTVNRKTIYFPVLINQEHKLFLSKAEWEEYLNNPSDRKFSHIREAIFKAESDAREKTSQTMDKGLPLNRSKFLNNHNSNRGPISFFEYYNLYLNELEEEERYSTASTYRNSLNSLTKFRSGKDFFPAELTPALLKEFERYLKNKNISKTTIGIYARSIRTVFNYIINKEPKLRDHYPFARTRTATDKYKIKKSSGKKGDALELNQLAKFIQYNPLYGTPLWLAHRVWLFSFYCHGMNFKDIALLKFKNIDLDKGVLSYVRKKTEDTERDEETLVIPIHSRIKQILEEFSHNKKNEDSLVFNLIKPDHDIKYLSQAIKNKTGNINKWLKYICLEIKIPRITTYWARHTFASILNSQLDENIVLISEMLGHSEIKTTKSYLKRFDNGRKIDVADRLERLLVAEISISDAFEE